MFEQATLSYGGQTKRVWTTCLGVTTQALVVTGMILVPLIWPEVLPKTQPFVPLAAPVVAPRPPVGEVVVRPRTSQSLAKMRLPWSPVLRAPSSVPKSIMTIDDAMEGPPAVVGSGAIQGLPGGIIGSIPGGLLDGMATIAPPRPPDAVPAKPLPAPASAPVKVGGQVAAALLRHRVDPIYPPLAKQMRVSGTVELRGIISTGGRIRELKVLSGHPLLAKAALDAVSQWVYEPTRLNGQPVEVDAPITVTFRLN